MARTVNPPFINHHRNDQPFSVIPAYYLQLFQGTAFPKASGDNDNVSNMRKPCNRIWLHAARLCQAVCLSRRMESDAKSVRQRPERQFFSTSEATQTGDYASAFYSCFFWSDTFSVITTTQQELKCKVASSAVTSKLMCMLINMYYSWTPAGAWLML